MKKICILLVLVFCNFIYPNNSTKSVEKFMENSKFNAKKLGDEEIKKCKLLDEKDRLLYAANYTGRAEELNSVIKILEESVQKANKENNEFAVIEGMKTIDILINKTVIYLYFNGIYRDNCSDKEIKNLFDNMSF